MKSKFFYITTLIFFLLLVNIIYTNNILAKPQDKQFDLPEAAYRTYAQDYKDSALAFCIAKAYATEPKAYQDAITTSDGIDNWTSYDLENSTGEIPKLVNKYLARKYNSIHGPSIHLNLLKCIDMYHSQELEKLVQLYVTHPSRTYAQDYPPDKN